MKSVILGVLGVLLLLLIGALIFLTQDGELVTPSGSGMQQVGGVTVEAFPLPDYAATSLGEDFKSYLVEVEPGIKVHVLEVGSGYPVYLQHGLPTSGFLYRKVAAALPRDQFRVIMPTMVGFGFSSKVPASEHTLARHSDWMNAVLTHIDVEALIFVGHDWGGPVGMGALVRSPELMQGAVILNTVLTAPEAPKPLALPLRIANTPLVGELLFEGLVSVFDQIASFQADPNSMSSDVVDLYRRPVEESNNAKGVLALMRMASDHPEHPSAIEVKKMQDYFQSKNMPVEIVWGMQDSLLAPRLPEMQRNFPNAPVIKTEGGHFLQEETPDAIAESIQRVHHAIQKGA